MREKEGDRKRFLNRLMHMRCVTCKMATNHDITPFIDIWHVTQRLCIRNRFFVADNILKISINMLTQKKQGQQKVKTTLDRRFKIYI